MYRWTALFLSSLALVGVTTTASAGTATVAGKTTVGRVGDHWCC